MKRTNISTPKINQNIEQYEQMETNDIYNMIRESSKKNNKKCDIKLIIISILLIILFILILLYYQIKINNLQSEIRVYDLEKRIKELHLSINDLENQNNDLHLTKSELENQNKELYLSKSELEDKYNDLLFTKLELEKKFENLSEYNHKIESELNTLNKAIKEYEKYFKEIKEEENIKKEIIESKKKEQNELYKSDIINKDEIDLILSWLNKKPAKVNLLLSAINHGDSLSTLFKKVKNKSPTLIVIKSDNGFRFGGYSSIEWKNDFNGYKDDNSFLFSLDLKNKYEPITWGLIFGSNSFIEFGSDLRICDKYFTSNKNYVGKKDYYSPDNFRMNGGKEHFSVSNIEVYEII